MKTNIIEGNSFLLNPSIKTNNITMISVFFALFTVVFSSFLPLQADAAMLGKDIDSHWSFTVGMEPSGEYGRSHAVGVRPNPLNPDITDFLFQAQGVARLQIQASYDGEAKGQINSVATLRILGRNLWNK